MNTSSVGPHFHHLDPLQSFANAASAGLAHTAVPVRLDAADRLARIRADRDLILSGSEGVPAPPYAAMPATQAPTKIVIASLELPSHGYAPAEPDEPSAQAGPVTPELLDRTTPELGDATAPVNGTDGDVQAGTGPGDVSGEDAALESGVQGLVAANSTGTSVTKRELAFLDDKSLSIEEKLFQFMVLMTKKGDQELVATMKQIEGKRGTTSSSSSSGSNSGSGSNSATGSSSGTGASSGSTTSGASTGIALPSTQASDSGGGSGLLGDVQSFIHDHAGDALALGATALGFPELAPIGKLAGPIVGDLVDGGLSLAGDAVEEGLSAVGDGLGAVGGFIGGLFGGGDGELVPSMARAVAAAEQKAKGQGVAAGIQDAADAVAAQVDQAVDTPAAAAATSSSSTGSTSSSSSSTSETLDEKLVMFNLERAVQKQNDMFAALSNILKSFDNTRMSIIQNLR